MTENLISQEEKSQVRVIDPGHHYSLHSLDAKESYSDQELIFVKRFRGKDNHSGTTNQEVLRVLINRVKFLHEEKPWPLNDQILYHLRMALVLHEARALIRKVEKGELRPEDILVNEEDGHFTFI